MKPHILLSENDFDLRQAWADALEVEKFEVTLAEGTRETLYRFCTQDSDLAILGLTTPAEEGLRLLSLMKQFRPLCPVIAVVANSDEYLVGIRPGLDLVLQSPVDPAKLVQTVKTLVAGWKPPLLEQEAVESVEPPFRISPRGGGRHYHRRTNALPKAAPNC